MGMRLSFFFFFFSSSSDNEGGRDVLCVVVLCGLEMKVVVDSETTGEGERRRFGLEGFEDGRVGFRNRTHLHLPCSCRFDLFSPSLIASSLSFSHSLSMTLGRKKERTWWRQTEGRR